MLEPEYAKKARNSALTHVQLSVSALLVPASFSGGECQLIASVERTFRGAEILPPGSTIQLAAYFYVPPDRSPTGPRWLDFDRLRVGTLLEAFLNRKANGVGFEVAEWQIAIIGALTEAPQPGLWECASSRSKKGFLRSLLRRFRR